MTFGTPDDQQFTHHPNIDGALDVLLAETEGDRPGLESILLMIGAAGKDIAAQMGRLADHFEIELVAREAAGFGVTPAGDPNVSTRDEADVARRAAK